MDLRSFIEQLNDRGQLHRIGRQVDWKYELGRDDENELAPLLFENIKDYPGHRVFTNGLISIAELALRSQWKREKPQGVGPAGAQESGEPDRSHAVQSGPIFRTFSKEKRRPLKLRFPLEQI